jgi:hypothetical protein
MHTDACQYICPCKSCRHAQKVGSESTRERLAASTSLLERLRELTERTRAITGVQGHQVTSPSFDLQKTEDRHRLPQPLERQLAQRLEVDRRLDRDRDALGH